MGKILPIVVIMLFIGVALAPTINANTDKLKDTTEPLDLNRTIFRGFMSIPFIWGDYLIFFALRCHYIHISGTSRETGIITLRWVAIQKDLHGYPIVGLLKIFTHIFGASFIGDFEPPDNVMRLNNQMRI